MKLLQIEFNTNLSLLDIIKKNVREFSCPKLKKNEYIYLLMDNICYVSMIYFSISKNECYINYIHTNPKYRRQGHSAFLINNVKQFCINNKIKTIKVTILPDCGSDHVFSKFDFAFVDEYSMICLC